MFIVYVEVQGYIYIYVHYIHNIYTYLSGMVNTLVYNLDVKKLDMSQMGYSVKVNPLNYQFLN